MNAKAGSVLREVGVSIVIYAFWMFIIHTVKNPTAHCVKDAIRLGRFSHPEPLLYLVDIPFFAY